MTSSGGRFLNVFGMCEMEWAAVRIIDRGLIDCEMQRADVADASKEDRGERVGFWFLVAYEWLEQTDGGFRATEHFKKRCRAAQHRDETGGSSEYPLAHLECCGEDF